MTDTLPPISQDTQAPSTDVVPTLDSGTAVPSEATKFQGFQAALVDRGTNDNADPDLNRATDTFANMIGYNGPNVVNNQMAQQTVNNTDKALLGGIRQDNFSEDTQALTTFYATMQGDRDRRLQEAKDNLSWEVIHQLNSLQTANEPDGYGLRTGQEDSKTFVDTATSETRARLQIANGLQDAVNERGQGSTLGKVVDILGLLTPYGVVSKYRDGGFNAIFGDASSGFEKQYYDMLNAPDDQRQAKIKAFVDSVSNNSSLIGENQFRLNDTLTRLKGIEGEQNKTGNDVLNAAGSLMDLSIVGGALKGLKLGAVSNALVSTGNRAQLATNITQTLTKGISTALMSKPEADDLFIRSGMNVGGLPKGLSPQMDMVGNITSGILDKFRTQPVSGLLTREEMNTAVDDTIQSVTSKLNSKYSVNTDLTSDNVDMFATTLGNALPSVDLYVGKGTGSGWLTRKAAENQITRLGLGGKAFFDTGSKEWFVKTTQDIDVNIRAIAGLNTDRTTAPVFKELASTASTLDDTVRTQASVNRGATENLNFYKNELANTWKKIGMNKEESKGLNEVWAKGNKNDTWYTDNQLRKMGMNEKQNAAYSLAKFHNDLAYDLNNRVLYMDRHARGLEEVKVSNKSINFGEETTPGKVYDNLSGVDQAHQLRLYDVEEGAFKPYAYITKKLESGSYKIVRFEGDAAQTAVGDPVKIALVRKNELSTTPLAKTQLNYQAGGRRYYESNWFIKQANIKAYTDDANKKIVLTPRTIAAAADKTVGDGFVENRNKALQAFRNLEGIKGKKINPAIRTNLQKAIHDYSDGEWTYESLKKSIASGELSSDPLELVHKNDLHSSLQPANRTQGTELFNPLEETTSRQYAATPGLDSSIISRSRGFRMQRGENIKDLNGNDASMLNVFEATDKTLAQAIRSGVWDTWRTRAVNSWFNSVEQLNSIGAKVRTFEPTISNFMSVVLDTNSTNPAIRKAADSLMQQRKDILRILNAKSEVQTHWESTIRKVAEKIEGSTGIKTTGWDIYSKNPINAIRAYAYHARLGVFQPSQLLLQASQMVLSFAILPQHAGAGMTSFHLLTLAQRNPEAAKALSRMMGKLNLVTDPEKMIDEYLKSGFGHVGLSVQQLDDIGMGSSYINKSLMGKVLDKGRMFFDAGEEASRAVAYGMAWNKTAAENLGLDLASDLGRQLVNKDASMLTFNMTSEFASNWNRGLASIPLQFKTYMFRTAELMMGKQLTNTQKASMIVVSALTYGVDAVPGLDTAVEMYTDKHGAKMSPETVKLLNSGLLDFSMSGITGADTNFSSRVGLGQSLTDEFRKLGALGDEGSASTMVEFFAGPSAGQVPTMYKAIRSLAGYFAGEQGATWEVTKDEITTDAIQLVGSLSTATKAWWAFQHSQSVQTSSLAPTGQVEKIQGVLNLLGIPPQVDEDYATSLRILHNSKSAIDEAAKTVLRLRRQAVATMDSDPEAFLKYSKTAAAFMGPLALSNRIKVLQAVNKKFDQQHGFEGLSAAVFDAAPDAAINSK